MKQGTGQDFQPWDGHPGMLINSDGKVRPVGWAAPKKVGWFRRWCERQYRQQQSGNGFLLGVLGLGAAALLSYALLHGGSTLISPSFAATTTVSCTGTNWVGHTLHDTIVFDLDNKLVHFDDVTYAITRVSEDKIEFNYGNIATGVFDRVTLTGTIGQNVTYTSCHFGRDKRQF